MESQQNYKQYGWAWIIISPILWLMAAISSVESITTYYIQLACFSIVAVLGLASGFAALFKASWASVVKKGSSLLLTPPRKSLATKGQTEIWPPLQTKRTGRDYQDGGQRLKKKPAWDPIHFLSNQIIFSKKNRFT